MIVRATGERRNFTFCFACNSQRPWTARWEIMRGGAELGCWVRASWGHGTLRIFPMQPIPVRDWRVLHRFATRGKNLSPTRLLAALVRIHPLTRQILPLMQEGTR